MRFSWKLIKRRVDTLVLSVAFFCSSNRALVRLLNNCVHELASQTCTRPRKNQGTLYRILEPFHGFRGWSHVFLPFWCIFLGLEAPERPRARSSSRLEGNVTVRQTTKAEG